MKTLRYLFLDELAEICDGEQRMAEALPEMIKAATCEQLQGALQAQLHDSAAQLEELEKVFADFGRALQTQPCKAMTGLAQDVVNVISVHDGSPCINAALICAAQRIVHYKMVTFAYLRDWAALLRHLESACLLDLMLDQEKAAEQRLNSLARTANRQALEKVQEPVIL